MSHVKRQREMALEHLKRLMLDQREIKLVGWSKILLIILQLKSAHNETALSDIGKILSYIENKYGYRIRGHEVHQNMEDLEKLTLRHRAHLVSAFCSKHDIEFITIHVPIPRNEGQSLFNELSFEKANDSILVTLREAEIIHRECGFKNKIIIVYHLPSVISLFEISYLDKERKSRIVESAEGHLIDFCRRNTSYFSSFATLTIENVFPKYFTNGDGAYATVGMFHPLEMTRLRKYGVKVTFDLSHYNIYSNYLLYGKGNKVGDLERQIYGSRAPSWKECIDLFGDSLIQLHISDSRGADSTGEGLMLEEGEIPIISILRYIRYGDHEEKEKLVQGTIELEGGHLYNCKLQRKAAEWLLVNTGSIFQ